MSGQQQKILVIDDSATIRRLADNFLSEAGYQVVLAPTAEMGVQLAEEIQPDLILLDHQLPGTTGCEVCRQLLERPLLAQIPVVISSTLRKKAYVEYSELDNVVDMLPKPYTAELLATTVRNGLDTGAMIVESQTSGSAVPEVIELMGEASLQGDLRSFSLRELLDFLNNAEKTGVLELLGPRNRLSFCLARGHVQGATATGIDATEMTARLPDSLTQLAPVLRMTLGGANGMDGMVELLDRRVVDPRLLRRLLRFQTAQLLWKAYQSELTEFRFQAERAGPPVVDKLPLEVSTLALLVDVALAADDSEAPDWSAERRFSRRMLRGQSVDRAGLSPQHIKLVSLVGQSPRGPQNESGVEGVSLLELSQRSGLAVEEVRRVLWGLELAGMVDVKDAAEPIVIAALALDAQVVAALKAVAERSGADVDWQEVRDPLTLKLLLRRTRPAALLFSLDDEPVARTVQSLSEHPATPLRGLPLVALGAPSRVPSWVTRTLACPPDDAETTAWLRGLGAASTVAAGRVSNATNATNASNASNASNATNATNASLQPDSLHLDEVKGADNAVATL